MRTDKLIIRIYLSVGKQCITSDLQISDFILYVGCLFL